jgi:SPP1 family predicted phage head-tail adaptor
MITGTLNRRVQIQQQTTSQDSFGQEQQTWTPIYVCWASIDIQNSQLLYSTAEFVEKVTYRITFRWTNSIVIQPGMRIVYTEATTKVTHTYLIEALLNTKAGNRELVAMCYELDGSE